MIADDTRDAHALAIGKIAMAWNEYHELLGGLFSGLFTKSHYTTTLAIWHCLDNDRTQRRLLRAAAETYLGQRLDKRGLEELLWLTLSWIAKKDHADMVEGKSARSIRIIEEDTTSFNDVGEIAHGYVGRSVGR
jgi:hypothetical protein